MLPAHFPRAPRLPLALLASLMAASLGCSREPETPRHFLLITVDTLRADHMSLYGYARATTPQLEEIARRGVVFERAIAQWPKTGASLASLFTGRYPQSTGLTHEAAIRIPRNLSIVPEVLQRQGFTTLAVVSNAVLSKELGWDRGFDEYVETWRGELTDDPVAYRKLQYAGRVNDLAVPLIRRHRDKHRLFLWIHYSDPHAPYILPEHFPNPFLDDELYRQSPDVRIDVRGRSGRNIGDADELRFYVAQYDANVLVVDRHVNELIGVLDELGLLHDSALVFLADHGEDLGEHRGAYFEHGPWPYNATAHVPLFVVGPGVPAGVRVQEPVELLDLFPTLLEWLAPEIEVEGLEGDALAHWLMPDRAVEPPPPIAFSEAGRRGRDHFRSVQDERWKLIYRPARRRREAHVELYDLKHDRLETQNLVSREEREARRLRRHLLDWMKGATSAAPAEQGPRSEQEIRALRALGYVE